MEREVPAFCTAVAHKADGAVHDAPAQSSHDREVRAALEDRGYRVVVVQAGLAYDEQVAQHRDIFW